jgi:very-short-patch-repair endonuclease
MRGQDATRPLGGIDLPTLPADPDRAAAHLADAQRGIVIREQLLACGLSADTIDRRLRRGWLRSLHRGVYALGHLALPHLARETAALFACGPGALISHRTAAALWKIAPQPPDAAIDVTVIDRNCGVKHGIRRHRATHLHPLDLTTFNNLPITAPVRTLLDIAPTLTDRDLERAFDEALVLRLITLHSARSVLTRYPHHRGAASLRALATAPRPTTLTRSHPEETFLALVRKSGLPQPEVNARLGRYTVDFLWRSERLVVEIDGYRFHGGRGAFERDHEKDLVLRELGIDVMRFTARQVEYQKEAVLVRAAQELARRR